LSFSSIGKPACYLILVCSFCIWCVYLSCIRCSYCEL
jgi:hypothetical protein